jgi:uncharacterized protein YciI
MKHFIITLSYKVPIEKIDELLVEHRDFLDSGYEKKILLSSGPKNPRDGGILIARAESLEAMKDFCNSDPFCKAEYAEYQYAEFIPVKYQKDFKTWFVPE